MQNNVQTINGVTWFDSLEERNAFLKQNGRHEFALEEAEKNAKQYLKLLDVIEEKTQIDVYSRLDSGTLLYGYVVLEPKKKYKIPEDKVLLEALRNKTIQKRYDSTMEEILKGAKIPYEVKKCNSCGGRIQKLFYKPVIVVETETKK